MKKIFITAVGGDIGYGVIKSLTKSNHELYIIGCDVQKYNYSYDLVDEFYVSPAYRDEEQWKDFVLEVLQNNGVEYFWPVTEPEIKIVNDNKELFEKYKVVMNKSSVLEIAMDKGRTAEYLLRAGIKTPQTWTEIASCEENYPMVVKEKFGCGSHAVSVVNNHNELIEEFNKMSDPIVQAYIGDADDEYTMTVFSDGHVVNSIAFKRDLGFGGMSRFVELVHDDKVDEIAHKIAALFDLKGSVNVQMRKLNGEYYVFEINPRISSTMGFRLQLGFNDTAWWIDMLEGNKVEQYIVPNKNVHGVRNVEEKLFYE